MNTKSGPEIRVECPKCGFERAVERADIISGRWRRSCPVCRPSGPEPLTPAGNVGGNDDAGDVDENLSGLRTGKQ